MKNINMERVSKYKKWLEIEVEDGERVKDVDEILNDDARRRIAKPWGWEERDEKEIEETRAKLACYVTVRIS